MSTHDSRQENPESLSDYISSHPAESVDIINEHPQYCKVEKSIYQDPRLTHLDRSIYAIICGLAGVSGRCFISDKKLSEEFCWMATGRFSRVTTKLHNLKLIYKRTRSQKSKINNEVWQGSNRECVPYRKQHDFINYLTKAGDMEEVAKVKAHFKGSNNEGKVYHLSKSNSKSYVSK